MSGQRVSKNTHVPSDLLCLRPTICKFELRLSAWLRFAFPHILAEFVLGTAQHSPFPFRPLRRGLVLAAWCWQRKGLYGSSKVRHASDQFLSYLATKMIEFRSINTPEYYDQRETQEHAPSHIDTLMGSKMWAMGVSGAGFALRSWEGVSARSVE